MRDETAGERDTRQQTADRWLRSRWLLPIANLIMAIAITLLYFGKFQDDSKLTAIQISQAVVQAYDQSQINANAAANAAFNQFLDQFVAEENFICDELVAHNRVLGGPMPPAGICNVHFNHTGSPLPSPPPSSG